MLSQAQRHGYARQIFLLTDGEVTNTSEIIAVVRKFNQMARVFTLGIGNNVSRALVAGVARAGNGTCEYVMDGERMERKIVKQLKRLNFQ